MKTRKFFLAALAWGLTLTNSIAIAESSITKNQFTSKTLNQTIKLEVYLPEGYQSSHTSYPVIYMLHGAGGDESNWRIKGGIHYTADALIERKQLRPSIIVMPTEGPHSWWVNGNAQAAENAFVNDLIPFIEREYRALSDRNSRAVAGLSMGGYGALNLSLTHPDLFCAAGIISPAIYDPLPPLSSASRTAAQFMKDGHFDEKTWENLLYPSKIESYKAAQKTVPMYIVSGDHDVFNIVTAAAKLFWTLHNIQANDVEYRVINGNHDWLTFRQASVPALRYIDTKCSQP